MGAEFNRWFQWAVGDCGTRLEDMVIWDLSRPILFYYNNKSSSPVDGVMCSDDDSDSRPFFFFFFFFVNRALQ